MDNHSIRTNLQVSSHHRRQASFGSAFYSERQGHLFDHFLIVGCNKESETQVNQGNTQVNGNQEDLKVLYQYPSADQLEPLAPGKTPLPLHQVIKFCFPKGLERRKLSLRDSQSELNSVLFGSLECVQRSANSFTFLLTHDMDVYYGICVQNDELLERNPSVTRTKAFDWDTVDTTTVTRRVYCFITKFPFFKAHYNVLYSIVARERLYGIEENAWSMRTNQDDPPPNLEDNEILTILRTYYTQHVPRSGESRTITFPNNIAVEVKCSKNKEDKLISDWCIPPAMKILKLEHLITLFHAAMLERHIIIVCKNMGVLSSVCLSLLPILRPFVWQGPYIPILPIDMSEYLHAPVPYIVGLVELPIDINRIAPDAIIYRIDKDDESISLPNDYHQLPNLPKYNKLWSILKPHYSVLNSFGLERYYNPIKSTEKQWDAVTGILEGFESYHELLLQIIEPYIKPHMDLTTDVEKKIIDQVPRKYRNFMREFMGTQMFSVYFEDYMKRLNDESIKIDRMTKQVNDKIKILESKRREIEDKIKFYQSELNEYQEEINVLRATEKSLHQKYPSLTHSSTGIIDFGGKDDDSPSTFSAFQFITSSIDALRKSATEKPPTNSYHHGK